MPRPETYTPLGESYRLRERADVCNHVTFRRTSNRRPSPAKSVKKETPREKKAPARSNEEDPLCSKVTGTRQPHPDPKKQEERVTPEQKEPACMNLACQPCQPRTMELTKALSNNYPTCRRFPRVGTSIDSPDPNALLIPRAAIEAR